jgi:nicotinamidase-related amidase
MSEAARPRFNGMPMAASPHVLLLVDWINPLEHPGAARLAPRAVAAARRTARLKRELARTGTLAVYANDNYDVWRSDLQTLQKRCHDAGGAAAEIARLLAPGPQDVAVLKPRHSAFFETPLQLLLQQVKAEKVVITGLVSEGCVLFTAIDAYVRGYRLAVPADCIASSDPALHRSAVSYLGDVLHADVRPAATHLPARARRAS